MALFTKRAFFCSFLNIIFLEKVICTFCLAKCIRKGQKLFRLTTWRIALFTKKYFFFCSFLNIIFLEKKVICTFCLAKCIRKGQQNCSFWLHEEWLSPQKEHFFWFLSECHLSRKECHLYFLPCHMHQKRKKKSFWLHEEWLSPQKEHFFCSFLNVISLEKNVTCTFCLAKCIRKGQKNCSFWLHEEWLSPQKEQFFCSFLNVIFLEKKRNLYFLPCQMHHKRTNKLFLLTTWRMALFTKRAFFLFLS